MTLPIYQIDAFTSRTFAGNPAAVCPLSEWIAPELRNFRALQLSERGGELFCELKGDRVLIGGHAVAFLEGEIYL